MRDDTSSDLYIHNDINGLMYVCINIFQIPAKKVFQMASPGHRRGFCRGSILGQFAAMAQPTATLKARHVVIL
jgi:hypothetical protein